MIQCKTSREIWKALETLFMNQTQAKYIQIYSQLASIKKGGDSVAEYLCKVTVLVDSLAAAENYFRFKICHAPYVWTWVRFRPYSCLSLYPTPFSIFNGIT